MSSDRVKLGSGLEYSFYQLGDVSPAGITIWEGETAIGSCMFDTVALQTIAPTYEKWQLVSLEPLHLEPSILMYEADGVTPGLHGYIRDGKWVSV